jgi:hypothetical protein
MVEQGKRFMEHVRARLEFISADSGSGSYKGPTGKGAVAKPWRQPAGELGERNRTAEASMVGPEGLVNVLRGWGQLKANDSGWLIFDGRYASYPRFKGEWTAYREKYHSVVNDDLAAKTRREKCMKGDALKMVSHLDDLQEIWDTLDTCFERPEKYSGIQEVQGCRQLCSQRILLLAEGSNQGGQGHRKAESSDQRSDNTENYGQDALHRLEGMSNKEARVAAGGPRTDI